MARRKKEKVVIIDEELRPTVLATIEEKKSSVLGIIVLFAIFLAIVYYLPEITSLYEKYILKVDVNPPVQKPQEDDPLAEPGEVTQYPFETNMSIALEGFTINNIAYSNNTFIFNIVNTSQAIVDLDKNNYYLEVFVSETLVKRIKLEDQIKVGETKSYSYTISGLTSITYLTVEKITTEDYPIPTLTDEGNGVTSLICENDGDTISYKFLTDELYEITHSATIQKIDFDYNNLVIKYQSLHQSYTQAGITSSLTDSGEYVTFNATIDLNKITVLNIDNKNLYEKDTSAKIVNFEVESRGYTCK